MNYVPTSAIIEIDERTRVIAAAGSADFGKTLLAFVSKRAKLRNFGTYYVANWRRPRPILSVWYGKIDDYWFRLNSDDVVTSTVFRQEIGERVKKAPSAGVAVNVWAPSETDFRYDMFRRAKICERLGITSRHGKSGFLTFFLRSQPDGTLTSDELENLYEVLPFVQYTVRIHHKLAGAVFTRAMSKGVASHYRAGGIKGFSDLSRRETDVCDCISRGLSVTESATELDVAENSIHVYRQRAFRKLGIKSAREAMVLMQSLP